MDGWVGSRKNARAFISWCFYLFTMKIQELQQWVAEDWKKQSKIAPSTELQLLFLLEELGEVAEAIRKNQGAKDRIENQVDLGGEMADVLISLCTLANTYDVDLHSEIKKFQTRLLKRHSQGF